MLGQRGEDWGAHWRPGAGGELARVGAHTGGGGGNVVVVPRRCRQCSAHSAASATP